MADPQDAQLLAAFEADFNDYVAKSAAFRALADSGTVAQAGAAIGSGPGDAAYNKLKKAISAWNDHKIAVAARRRPQPRRAR